MLLPSHRFLLLLPGLCLYAALLTVRSPSTAFASQAEDKGKTPVRTDVYGDPLPSGAFARLGSVRYRLGGSFVAFSPDGRLLASLNNDYTDAGVIGLWEVDTGKEVHRLVGHTNSVSSVAFSPDGKVLVSVGSDRTVRLWEVKTGKQLRKLADHHAYLRSVCFSSDGRMIGAASGDKTVCVWERSTGKLTRQLRGHRASIRTVLFAPDSQTLISCSEDDTIRFWSLATGQEVKRIDAGQRGVYRMALSPDGRFIASAGEDHICLWDLKTGKTTFLLRARDISSMGVAFSPDGRTVAATTSASPDLVLWEVATGKRLKTYRGGGVSLTFSPDGKLLALAGGGRLLEVATGKDLRLLQGYHRAGSLAAFAPDGKSIATAGRVRLKTGELKGSIRLWDSSTGKLLSSWDDHEKYVRDLVYSPDGQLLALAGYRIIYLIDPSTGREIRRLVEGDSLSGSMAFSPDGKFLLSGGFEGLVRVWEVSSGRVMHRLAVVPKGNTFTHLVFSPSRKHLAVSGGTAARGQSGVALWELGAEYQPRLLWSRPLQKLKPLVFSPTGKTLAAQGHLWEVATGSSLDPFSGKEGWTTSLAFSPDGKILVSPGSGRTISLWDQTSCERIGEVAGHHGIVTVLAFSPDGKSLLSTSWDNTMLLWDVGVLLKDWRPQRRKPEPEELERLWVDLASDEGATAYRAIWALVAAPKLAVPFLNRQLRPKIDPQRIARLITDLDNPRFAVREKGSRELQRMGLPTRDALEKALLNQPSLEVRCRVEKLLKRLANAELRLGRVIEILEYLDSAEAREVLKYMTREARSTSARQAAVEALSRHQKSQR